MMRTTWWLRCCLISWLFGCLGIRVGEAANPGPILNFDDSDELPFLIDADSETDREEGGAWGWDDHQVDDNASPSAADTVEDLQEFQIFVNPL